MQTVQNTVHIPGSMCSTMVQPVGRRQGKRGAALPYLTTLNHYEGTVEYQYTYTKKGSLEKRKYTLKIDTCNLPT